jgi:LysM repeat protein
MKMPTLPKMKMPKLPKLPKPQPKRLQATARRAAPPAMDDYDDEPTTRLSSAFIVVLILHVVAVGGIYAFNSIKANRRSTETSPTAPIAAAKTSESAQSSTVEKAVNSSAGSNPILKSPVVPASTTRLAPISGSKIYSVRNGDTVSKVALQHGVSVEDLQEANGLKAGGDIRVGQALNIPVSSVPSKTTASGESRKNEATIVKKQEPIQKTTATAATGKTYTVKKGDNPVTIAKKFGVSSDELLKVNKIDDPKKLRIDQVLKIPAKKD